MDTQDSVKTPAQDAVKKDTGAPISSSGSSVSSRFFVLNFMKNHQELQTHVYQTYKMLRYVLAFGYIISALLKIPALYEMFVLAYQVYQSKKEQAAASDQKEPPPPPSREMIANIAFLYIAFIVLIISQLVLGFKFAVRRFSGLIGYIAWFTFYLLFVSTAYFRDLSSSTMPLGFALFMVQYSLFGFWMLDAPVEWHYRVLKISIGGDFLLFLATFLFFILITKYKEYTLKGTTLKDRSYNLVQSV